MALFAIAKAIYKQRSSVERSRHAAGKATNLVYFSKVSNPNHLQSIGVHHEEVRSKTICRAYERHLKKLKLQGKSEKTIDAYAQAVRRIKE